MNNISFIICTKNIEKNNYNCLKSLENFPVIIVDKNSKIEILDEIKKYKNVKIIKQKGNGLANARNLGLRYVKTKYVVMFGCDNILKDIRDIKKIIGYIKNKKWIGGGFLTRVYKPETYFDKCMNFWWKNKIKEEERQVVGTPILYRTDILKKFKYSENCTHSDDTDLGERLYYLRYKQGYSNIICYDITDNNFDNIYDRFSRYGVSDQEYHEKYCVTFRQKIKSYLHTFLSDFYFKIDYIPFWFMIMIIRFLGRWK